MKSLRDWAFTPTGADTTDARRARPANRRGIIAGAAITAIVGATLMAGAVAPAHASLVGPLGAPDADSGFPISYSDGTIALGQCLDGGGQCLAEAERPDPGPVAFPGNFPAEFFWFNASAVAAGQAQLYTAVLEGAFANDVPADGDQMSFARLRFRLDNLVANASYTIQHPYGTHVFRADAFGVIDQTSELGCDPELGDCDHAIAGAGFLGNSAPVADQFLTQTNPVTGFIGDIDTPGTVTGAPSGLNAVIVTGPNAGGQGVNTLRVNEFTVQGDLIGNPVAPAAPLTTTATAGNNSALVRWSAPGNGGSIITQYSVQAFNAAGTLVGSRLINASANTSANSVNFTGLTNQAYRFKVTAKNAQVANFGALSPFSAAVTPRTVASFPVIVKAAPGTIGGTVTARANWLPPASNGGFAITGYVVTAMRINTRGSVMTRTNSATQHFSVRTLSMTLPAGNYRFAVRARNALGMSAYSTSSQVVTAR
jgi:Fibronectin type III domain